MSFLSSIIRRTRPTNITRGVVNTRALSTSAARNSFTSAASTSSISRLGLVAVTATALSFGAYHFYSSSSSPSIIMADNTNTSTGSVNTGGLDPKNFQPLKLKSVDNYNYNTKIYHFALPDANGSLNLPVSSCIMTQYKGDDGKPVIRPYTPIDTHHKGELILLVKEYPNGKMSKYIANMNIGDSLDVKGPVAKLKYEPNMKKKLGFIVGGTGVTPALQVIDEILSNPGDKTELHLLFANVSGRDILLKETIDDWASQHKNFHVNYIIDKNDNDKDFKGEIGRIDKKMIEKLLPIKSSEGKDVLVYVCGPPAMYEAISGGKAKDYSQGPLSGVLKELGFNEEQVYKF